MKLVVLDSKRTWPDNIFGVKVDLRKRDLVNNLEDVLLYLFHYTDWKALKKNNKAAVLSKPQKFWPQNILWYSGGDIDSKRPGLIYDNQDDDAIFKAAKKIVKNIFARQIAKKVISEKRIPAEIWSHLSSRSVSDELLDEILTPLVVIHNLLTTKQNRMRRLSKISPTIMKQNKDIFTLGERLFKDDGRELVAKVRDLIKIPGGKSNESSNPALEYVNKFIKIEGKKLHEIFKLAVDDCAASSLSYDVALTQTIEQLCETLRAESARADVRRKIRSFRHDIENVISRLRIYISKKKPFSEEHKRGFKKELTDMKKSLNSLRTEMFLKYCDLNIEKEIAASLKVLDESASGNDADLIVVARKLITNLQQVVNLTLNVVPRGNA